MAEADDTLQEYDLGPVNYGRHVLDKEYNWALPKPEPRHEARPAQRPDDWFTSRARDYIGPNAVAQGAYGLGAGATNAYYSTKDAVTGQGDYGPATQHVLETLAAIAGGGAAKGKGRGRKSGERGAGEAAGAGSQARGVPDGGGVPGGERGVQAPSGLLDQYTPVPNQPRTAKIPGHGEVEVRPIPQIEAAARDFAHSVGRDYERPVAMVPHDVAFAKRVADAYEAMKHDPTNPEVRRAYETLMEETLGQYNALLNHGFKFKFNEPGQDPYKASPALGYIDMRDKGELAVFPTLEGFGSGAGLTKAEIANSPMLTDAGVKFGDKPATMNDVFRAVHDAYGHNGPGNPFFRHQGEDRAWQHHSILYGPRAIPAATSELRGQNSWLNFGPYGDKNRSASAADTIYADQKVGLMDPFTWSERIPEREVIEPAPKKKAEGGKVEETAPIVPTMSERARKLVDHYRRPPEDWEGVDEAVLAHKYWDRYPDWFKPVGAFAQGALMGIPLTGLMIDSRIPNSAKGNPSELNVRNQMAHARSEYPRSYYAGLGLGMAPTLAFPKFGVPWIAYNIATDPGVQRTVRDYMRGRTQHSEGGEERAPVLPEAPY